MSQSPDRTAGQASRGTQARESAGKDCGTGAGRWLRRGVIALGAAALFVLPQLSTNAVFVGLPGVPGPLTVVVLGLALLLMPVLLAASWVADGRARMPAAWMLLPAGLVAAGAVVSAMHAPDRAAAVVRGAQLAALWAAGAALAGALRSDAERRFLLAALVAAGAATAAVAAYQAAVSMPATQRAFEAAPEETLRQLGLEPGTIQEKAFRARFSGGVQAATGHPNVLATLLVMSMLVGVGLAREKWTEARARAMAAVPAAAAALCAVGIVLTQGRAGQAAALAGLWWLGVAWRVRPGRLRVALYAAPLVAGAIALAAATQIHHPAVEGVLLTLRYRLDYWGGALAVLRQDLRWLTGVGLENFGLFYVEHKPAWSPEEVSDPHNLVLSVWCSLGAAGLAAIISLAVLAVRSWLRPHRAAGGDAGLPGLMAPAALAAAPGMIVFFLVGPGWGVLALAAMTLAAALCAAEDPRRLAASGRAPASLRQAAIVALVAFALAETIGTAILEPPTAWAMLVLVAVTLVPRSRSRAASAQEPVISSEAREAGRVEKSRRGSHAPAGTARFLDSLRSLGMTDSCGETPSTRTQPDGPGVRLSAPLKFLLTLAMMGGMYAYLTGLVLPVGRERALLAEARAAETPEEQAELLRDAAAARPSSWEPHLLRARLWQDEAARGRGPQAAMAVERAVDAYRDVLERQPRLRFVYMAMADCLLGLPGSLEDPQALDAARHYLEEASRLYPTSIITRLRLADVTDRAGDEAAALDEYREVLRLDAATPEPALRLAPDIRAAVENRVRQLAESVATPAAVE